MWKNITSNNIVLSHIVWLPFHFIKAVLRRDTAFISGFFKAIYLSFNIIAYRKDAKENTIEDSFIVQPFISEMQNQMEGI